MILEPLPRALQDTAQAEPCVGLQTPRLPPDMTRSGNRNKGRSFWRTFQGCTKQIQEQEHHLIPLSHEKEPWWRSDQHLPGDSHHPNSRVLMAQLQ